MRRVGRALPGVVSMYAWMECLKDGDNLGPLGDLYVGGSVIS